MKAKVDFIGGVKDIVRQSPVEIEVSDMDTVNDLLNNLNFRYQGLKDRLFMSNGSLQSNVYIYIRDEKIEGLDVILSDYKNRENEILATIFVLQAFTGGAF